MMAKVNGRAMEIRVPFPGSLASDKDPRKRSICRLMASMPTPRPETPVTARAVEKPGSRIRFEISLSLRTASRAMSCFSMALARTASRSMPRPSSSTLMTTCDPTWSAESRMVARRGLPLAIRSSGGSTA